MARTTLGLDMADTFTSSDTVVKGMNCGMLPRLPCSRQSTHSSMNHCTNCVWGPAVREPRMEEMSRNRLARTRFSGSLMLTVWSWEADRELLMERSVGLERMLASSSLELSSRISFEGCMSSRGKRLM